MYVTFMLAAITHVKRPASRWITVPAPSSVNLGSLVSPLAVTYMSEKMIGKDTAARGWSTRTVLTARCTASNARRGS
jgi:hypothetical protein